MPSSIGITKKDQITDTFLLNQGMTLFDNSKTGNQLFRERMKKDMDLYDGKFSTQERKVSNLLGIPKLFIPKTYVNTQRIHVDVLESIYNDTEEIINVLENKEIPMEYAKVVKTMLNYYLRGNPINFYQEAYEGSLDAIRNMISIMKIWPEVETEKRPVKKLKNMRLEDGTEYQTYVEEEMEHIAYFEPHMECVPPEDIFFSKRATWKDYYKYPLVHRYKRTRDALKRMKYKNVDIVPEDQTGDELTDVVKYQRNQDYQDLFNDQTDVHDEQEVYVFECWDFLPGDDGKLVSGSYVLLGDQLRPYTVARGWVPNDLPYKFSRFEHNRPPFVLGEAYPEPHRIEGKSYPQITESLQMETNAQRNQEREAVARDLRGSTYVNREANVDLMALTNKRIGGYVLGDGPMNEAMGIVPSGNSAAILARTQARTDNDYYETGLPPNLLGADTNSDTATGDTQQLSNANKKIVFVIKNLAYTLYLPSFKFLLRLMQAYETDEKINAVTGKYLGWKIGNPAREAVQGDYDLEVNLGTNKQSQINKYLLIMDRIIQANTATGQLLQLQVLDPQNAKFGNVMKVFEQLLPLIGIKKTDEFELPSMQPPPQEGGPVGTPSPPRQLMDSTSSVSNMSPAAPGMVNG